MQTALDGADLYHWFASGFGNFDHLTSSYTTPFNVAMIEGLVSLTVQSFFIYRIMVLSERRAWWLCIFILLVRNLSPRLYLWSYLSPLKCSIVSTIGAFSAGVWVSILRSTSQRNYFQLEQTQIHSKFATGRALKLFTLVRLSSKD